MTLKNTSEFRIQFSNAALEKITGWTSQIEAKLPSVSMNRSELISSIIENLASELSISQLKVFSDSYFDPMRSIKELTLKVRRARQKGEEIEFEKLVQETLKQKHKPMY